jgi:predicted RNase H-like nuclease
MQPSVFTQRLQKSLSPCGKLSLKPSPVIGVDGCPGGWFAFSSTGDFQVYPRFSDLVTDVKGALVLVDIPMGLPIGRTRTLESKARRLLKGKGSSVFPVPGRNAIFSDSYEQACEINFRQFGRKLSKQVWNITGKIREVDNVLQNTPSLSVNLYESHPELCFHRLCDTPLSHSKKTPAGFEERMAILEKCLPRSNVWIEKALLDYPRRILARDDVLDALALVATGSGETELLEDDDPVDELGLPIRMMIPAEVTGRGQ